MQLSKETLSKLNGAVQSVPTDALFALPEKVLQFGTGVLLRGLPDYFIDKANKKGIFNGRVVIVKSTDSGGTDAYEVQNGLFTHCISGIRQQKNYRRVYYQLIHQSCAFCKIAVAANTRLCF